jgi:hypothetical protein
MRTDAASYVVNPRPPRFRCDPQRRSTQQSRGSEGRGPNPPARVPHCRFWDDDSVPRSFAPGGPHPSSRSSGEGALDLRYIQPAIAVTLRVGRSPPRWSVATAGSPGAAGHAVVRDRRRIPRFANPRRSRRLPPASPRRKWHREPIFHEPWEGRIFALSWALGALVRWNFDASPYDLQRLPPADYLRMS